MLEKGTYELSLDTSFARPGMKVEEVDEWLDIRNFPLWVEIGGTAGKEMPAAASQTGKKDKATAEEADEDQGLCGVLTDTRGRKLSLCQIAHYYGSSRVTPRTNVAGKTISDQKYHRVDFEDIKRIEHRIEDLEPSSGMKYPMFQKVTMRDGEVRDMLGCKPCGFGGKLPDGKKIHLWNTQVRSVEFEKWK